MFFRAEPGAAAQTADHWVRSAQKLDWLVVEEITQLDMALWADLACVGLNADVKFLLLGNFRQLPAVLDSWAGRPISVPLEHSQLIRDLAGGHRHELTENMRSDPGIFNFVKWLRVGEEACPTLEQAKARLKELYPSKPGWPDTTLVISHSKRMAVNAAANRRHAGLPQHLHVYLAHHRALMGVLYGHEFPPLGIGLNVQRERKLHCEVRLLFLSIGKKSGPMNVRACS